MAKKEAKECFKRLFDFEKEKLETLASQMGLFKDELYQLRALLLNRTTGGYRLLGQFEKKRTFVLANKVKPKKAKELIRTWRRIKALHWYQKNL